MNEWISPKEKQVWNVPIHVWNIYFGFVINTTAYHLGQHSHHLRILKNSLGWGWGIEGAWQAPVRPVWAIFEGPWQQFFFQKKPKYVVPFGAIWKTSLNKKTLVPTFEQLLEKLSYFYSTIWSCLVNSCSVCKNCKYFFVSHRHNEEASSVRLYDVDWGEGPATR